MHLNATFIKVSKIHICNNVNSFPSLICLTPFSIIPWGLIHVMEIKMYSPTWVVDMEGLCIYDLVATIEQLKIPARDLLVWAACFQQALAKWVPQLPVARP